MTTREQQDQLIQALKGAAIGRHSISIRTPRDNPNPNRKPTNSSNQPATKNPTLTNKLGESPAPDIITPKKSHHNHHTRNQQKNTPPLPRAFCAFFSH